MKYDIILLHGKFQNIMRLSQQLDKSPKRFGTDELLTHSEIHLIEIIGSFEGASVTDLGKKLGITKGAISQTLKKLEAKGYTKKEAAPENLSRAVVMLTTKGQTAYWAHKHWHDTMDGGFADYLENLNQDDLSTILEFLKKTEDFLGRRLRSLE